VLREDYCKQCRNQNLQPDSQATYLRQHMLRLDLPSTCAQRLAFASSDECTAEALQAWVEAHVTAAPSVARREQAMGTCYVHGNLSPDAAEALGAAAAETFGVGGGASTAWRPEERIVKLKRLTLCAAPAQNPDEESSAVEWYCQLMPDTLPDGSPDPVSCATLDLLGRLIGEPAFDVLRTKEQLGYSVNAGVRRTCGVLGFCVTVLSAKASPLAVEARIEAFLQEWRCVTLLDHCRAVHGSRLRWCAQQEARARARLCDVPRLADRGQAAEGHDAPLGVLAALVRDRRGADGLQPTPGGGGGAAEADAAGRAPVLRRAHCKGERGAAAAALPGLLLGACCRRQPREGVRIHHRR